MEFKLNILEITNIEFGLHHAPYEIICYFNDFGHIKWVTINLQA